MSDTLAERVQELELVNQLVSTLTSTLELPEILRIVLDRIKTLTRAEALSLLLYEAERDELVFAATETLRENALVGLRVPLNQSIAGWVAQSGKNAIVNDPRNDPRFYALVDHVSRFVTRNLLSVPLRRSGRSIGVLELANRYGGVGFAEEDARALGQIAAELASEMDLEGFSRDAHAMQGFFARVAAAVPSEAAALLLFEGNRRELVFRASRTLQPGVVDGLRLSADRGIAGWVARNREAVRLDDVKSDPRYYSGVELETKFIPRTMICVPMISKDTLRGVIQVINKIDGSCFTENELRLTQTLADHAAIAIENASLYRQAYLASITDDLTGLGNTRQFNRILPEQVAYGGPLSLLVLDFDGFKAVVDRYGHLAGSRTIGELGKRIGAMLRPGDFAARFGGDEFVILLPATGSSPALELAESIRGMIADVRTLEDGALDVSGVTASVGVATFPDHAADAESLFRAADGAMYAVKRAGKNAVALAR